MVAPLMHVPLVEPLQTAWLVFRDHLERYFATISVILPEPFFHTQAFLAFFAIVFLVYWSVPRRWALLRIWILLIASFHFYAAWSRELALLVTATTCADYCFGRFIGSTSIRGLRRFWLLVSISMNLGILCYFKYRGFFLNELHDFLTRLGYDPGYGRLDVANIIIPFGISFYTFEAISYVVDVYTGKIEAEKSLPRFLLFILFFPHLVSGPIVRAGDFLTQTRRIKRWNWLRIQVGVQLFLMGAFKKMAIADRMALFCDPIFQNPEAYRTTACWLAVLAYALRIYCDFSGYSDMAVGLGHLFGYKLTFNFNMPYLSPNISEFWRRWHISLSSWLRDYLFIPLGGSRGSRGQTYRNLMIVMVLGGLWHGAAWGYVLWGFAHGLLLVIHRVFRDSIAGHSTWQWVLTSLPGTVARIALTFTVVSLCWVLFQPDLERAWAMYQQLFMVQSGEPLPLHNRSLWYTVLFVLVCHLLVATGLWQRVVGRLPAPVLGTGYAVCACAAMLLAPDQGTTFIYFQF
ncbi:MAG: MBOAT family protein [Gemmataceae bacterium]|nr:MBOAT family protein [Gemmataceae bacterium]MCS7269813.1 MBOAT family protein [Gemmataceae bacterium]MDW8244477.1 MBOAT family O-acyltransferase [Thermogemmata sp.]